MLHWGARVVARGGTASLLSHTCPHAHAAMSAMQVEAAHEPKLEPLPPQQAQAEPPMRHDHNAWTQIAPAQPARLPFVQYDPESQASACSIPTPCKKGTYRSPFLKASESAEMVPPFIDCGDQPTAQPARLSLAQCDMESQARAASILTPCPAKSNVTVRCGRPNLCESSMCLARPAQMQGATRILQYGVLHACGLANVMADAGFGGRALVSILAL